MGTDNSQPVDVLIVEDNADDLDLALHVFKKQGLPSKFFVVRDGAEALDYLFCAGKYASRDPKNLPKFILLDVKLPKVGGLEVLRKVKMHDETKKIPVVMLTSSSEKSDLIDSYSFGANSYIVKPVEFEKFRSVLQQLGEYWLSLNKIPALVS